MGGRLTLSRLIGHKSPVGVRSAPEGSVTGWWTASRQLILLVKLAFEVAAITHVTFCGIANYPVQASC